MDGNWLKLSKVRMAMLSGSRLPQGLSAGAQHVFSRFKTILVPLILGCRFGMLCSGVIGTPHLWFRPKLRCHSPGVVLYLYPGHIRYSQMNGDVSAAQNRGGASWASLS